MRLHRCRLSVDEHSYVISVKNRLNNFIRLEYRNGFQPKYSVDRHNGTIGFTMPDEDFPLHFSNVAAYFGSDNIKKHFKRTRIKLKYLDFVDV